MLYYVFPTCFVASNPRAGRMSIATIAMPTFYAPFCYGLSSALDFYRAMPAIPNPSGKPIYLLVRDSIDRFVSACALYQMDISTSLEKLPVLMANDDHFGLQSAYQFTQAFRFDTGIAAFCAATGLPSLPVTNETLAAKATLTTDQTATIQAAYAPDIALFNSLAGS